jgi:hypothetical protein
MRKLVLSVVASLAAVVFAACVGDDPTIAESPGSDGGGRDDGSTPPADGSTGDHDANTSADAPCGAGLATCGAGPACATKLTEDPSHCGACGHACMGGGCLAGQCQPQLLASGFPLPVQANIGNGLAIDDQNLYFATDTRVYKVSKTPSQDAGDAAVMLHEAAGSGDRPRFVEIANTTVWWTSRGTAVSSGKVWRTSRDAAPGAATAVASTQNMPEGIGVDGTYVYWTANGAPAQDQGVIRRSQLVGGSGPIDVITGQLSPRHLLVGSGRLYWDLAVANVNVLYTANKTPGATPNTIVDLGDDHVSEMALTPANLYWVTYKGAVWRASIDGANPVKLHTGTSAGTSVAVDDSGLYASFQGIFGDQYKNAEIVQVNAPAGQPVTVKSIATLPYVQGIAIDADFVYAVGGDYPTTATGGKLWRIRR